MKKLIAIMLCIAASLCLFSCGSSIESADGPDSSDPIKVEMSVRDYGKITLELYPDVAPITVKNFVELVSSGYYDGLTFHRIIEGFMIQGGMGGNASSIKGEFSANGVENNLKHERGVISMARTSVPDSASSQFFIVHQTSPHLDGLYAAFGKVIDGMDTVDKIAAVPTDANDAPTTPVVIDYVKLIED